jgi:homoprotocatechuate degradation regulator HpaR
MAADPPSSTQAIPTVPPVANSLPVRLLRARESVMSRLRPILRSHGLTEQQWRVMRTVRDHVETEITVLAGLVFLLPPSLSRILRDLEGRGLLARRASKADQRRAMVSLTPAGEALIARAQPDLRGAAVGIYGLFGEQRLEELYRLLTELEECLGLPAGGVGEGE